MHILAYRHALRFIRRATNSSSLHVIQSNGESVTTRMHTGAIKTNIDPNTTNKMKKMSKTPAMLAALTFVSRQIFTDRFST